jgi:hypothetical protein
MFIFNFVVQFLNKKHFKSKICYIAPLNLYWTNTEYRHKNEDSRLDQFVIPYIYIHTQITLFYNNIDIFSRKLTLLLWPLKWTVVGYCYCYWKRTCYLYSDCSPQLASLMIIYFITQINQFHILMWFCYSAWLFSEFYIVGLHTIQASSI